MSLFTAKYNTPSVFIPYFLPGVLYTPFDCMGILNDVMNP